MRREGERTWPRWLTRPGQAGDLPWVRRVMPPPALARSRLLLLLLLRRRVPALEQLEDVVAVWVAAVVRHVESDLPPRTKIKTPPSSRHQNGRGGD